MKPLLQKITIIIFTFFLQYTRIKSTFHTYEDRTSLHISTKIAHVMRVHSCTVTVCAINASPREEHDVEENEDYYCSCCSDRVFTLVKDTESGADALHDFETLFF